MRKVTLVPFICLLLAITACTVGIARRQEIVSEPTAVPPSVTPVAKHTETLQNLVIYLIALEDDGQSGKPVGCGDSVIPVTVTISQPQDALQAALEALFSVKEQFYGESGLYNALYQSDLRVESAAVQDGTAIIRLSGTLTLGGECDNPRVQAQIEETALQFATVNSVDVFLNGQPLEEALSLKGD